MITLLKIPDERQKRIVDYFSQQIAEALRSRSEAEESWTKWLRMFHGKPEQKIKTFPWYKASNVVINILSITVNAFVARQINSMFQYKPFWTVTALNKRWTDHAVPTQRLLEYAQRFEMRLLRNLSTLFYDLAIYGTAIGKLSWITETKTDKRYDDKGNITKVDMTVADGPRFTPISISNVIFPVQSFTDVNKMPWVAHRFYLRLPQLRERERAGFYFNIDKIERAVNARVEPIQDERERLQQLTRLHEVGEYELYEVWADYDYDNDGIEENCVFTICPSANVMVRATLNPFLHRKRPFIVFQCFPSPHSIYGIGFGQKLEILQEAITTQANQAIDNASIANVRCFKYVKGSGIKPPIKIYPGKGFALTSTSDLEPFQLGEIYPSSNLIINFLRDVCERETGISDYSLGKESSVVKSGATATSTLALIQEGSRLFDFLLKNVREDLNEAAYQVYTLYSQFKPAGLTFSLLDRDGTLVEETWNAAGEEDVRRCFLFELSASSSHTNQMIERQSWVELLNMIMAYYGRIFDAAQAIVSPQTPPELRQLLGKMVSSGTLIMDRLIERWGILDRDRLILQPEDIQVLMQQAEEAAPQRAQAQQLQAIMTEVMKNAGKGRLQQRGPGGPAGAPGPPGVPPLPPVPPGPVPAV